jgi:hypothetical protein
LKTTYSIQLLRSGDQVLCIGSLGRFNEKAAIPFFQNHPAGSVLPVLFCSSSALQAAGMFP